MTAATAMAMDTEPPLDPAVIVSVCGHDRGAQRELARRFLAFHEHDARMLGHAIGRQDLELTALVAERMKASAESIGAGSLALACEAIAKAASQAQWHRVVGAMGPLRRESERLLGYLKESYPEP